MLRKNFTFLMAILFAAFILGNGWAVAQPCADGDPTYPVGISPVTERLHPGDPYCGEGTLAYRINFGEHPSDGWYPIPGGQIYLDFSTDDCGPVVEWTAGVGIKVNVIVAKGGTPANIYDYTGEDPMPTTDGNLHCPTNDSDKYAGFSYLEFCYTLALQIEKTAETSYNLRYDWTIDKESDAVYDLFKGDMVTHDYVVSVVKDEGTAEDIMVTGTISIYNPAEVSATIVSIEDVIPGYDVDLTCEIEFPYILEPGQTLECTYEVELDDLEELVNTVTVVTSGTVEGGVATADITFGDPDSIFYDEITVTDSYYGELGTTDESTSWSYSRDLTCFDAEQEFIEEETYENTATIEETGATASASVTIYCWELEVTKDASASFDRTYTWDIDKEHDAGEDCLVLAEGQVYTVNYTVTVTAVSEDDNWAVEGEITVYNPAPIDAVINSLSDIIDPTGIALDADVECTVEFPYVLEAGESLTCSYSASLDDSETRENEATVVLQNFNYHYDAEEEELVAEAAGTTDFSGTAEISFENAAINEIDECVDVYDAHDVLEEDLLGTVCYPFDEGENVFEFSHDVGIAEGDEYECDEENLVPNTARFITNDTETEGEADEEVCFIIPCPGCTLTPGYWKTHSSYGPAPYDDTWAMLGEDTPFFLSGQTYYEVLWTSPSGGNAYYILAHAYIAAELNGLNGTSLAAVQTEFDAATVLFETYTPAQVAAFKGKTAAIRNQFIALAEVLDDYNNGIIGPGHCDDNNFEAEVKSASVDLTPAGEVTNAAAFRVYPNPFSREVRFEFTAEKDGHVRLEIFNATGQKVKVLMDQQVKKGVANTISFVPDNQVSGMFIYRLSMDDEVQTGRLLYRKE